MKLHDESLLLPRTYSMIRQLAEPLHPPRMPPRWQYGWQYLWTCALFTIDLMPNKTSQGMHWVVAPEVPFQVPRTVYACVSWSNTCARTPRDHGRQSAQGVKTSSSVIPCYWRFVTRFFRSTNLKDINSRTRLLAEGLVCWSEGARKKREKNEPAPEYMLALRTGVGEYGICVRTATVRHRRHPCPHGPSTKHSSPACKEPVSWGGCCADPAYCSGAHSCRTCHWRNEELGDVVLPPTLIGSVNQIWTVSFMIVQF